MLAEFLLFTFPPAPFLRPLFCAETQRITVSRTCATPADCPLLLHAALDTTVDLKLTQPIVCDANISRECSVVVLLTNSNPGLVAVNPCAVKWTSLDWFETRTVRLQAVQNFNQPITGVQTVTITTEAAKSPAAFYNTFNPYDIAIRSANRPSAQCRSTGDPHYTTFDGAYWHFYDGNTRPRTLVHLVRATNPSRPFGDLQIQSQIRGYPATNCALAGREGNNLVILDVCGPKFAITTRFGAPDQLPRIEVTGNTYTVYFRSGFWMRAGVSSYYMDIYVQAPGLDYNNVCGLCGNIDGVATNDFTVYMSTMYRQLNP